MDVNFIGYGENVATFIADRALTQAGVPVKISGNGTVTQCAANENFCGICVGVRDGYAAVQLSGYARFETVNQLTVGYQKLTAAANGKITAGQNGRELLVVDSTATDAGVIL